MKTASLSQPYDWLQTVQVSLLEREKIPPPSGPAAFSWQILSQQLVERFEIQDLSISLTKTQVCTDRAIVSDLPKNPLPLYFTVGSLPGNACWLMGGTDIALLMAGVLTQKAEPLDIQDPDFQEGFYHFAALEIIHLLTELGLDEELEPRLIEGDQLPTGTALCLDLAITLCQRTVKGRLVVSQELQNSWQEHFSKKKHDRSVLPKDLMQKIDVTLSLQGGKVTLSPREWNNLRLGDIVILDSCTIFLGEEKSRVLITANGLPVFRGMLKQDKVKILEYPLYHEMETSMQKKPESQEGEDAELLEAEEPMETEESAPNGDKKGIPLDHLPLTVVIEVGRIKMNLAKLAELQPGQLLELDVKTDEGVDLVVNDRCIGHGELLRVGEALGVRILDLD